MPRVSIIVPVYNAVKYLGNCLSSILDQVYKDWECIIVNDGSYDGSQAICDAYAAKDGRFSVIHQTNRGVSSARNRGLADADGEFLCFVDADDYLGPDFLLKMCGFEDNPDIVISGQVRYYEDGRQTVVVPDKPGLFTLTPNSTSIIADLEKTHLLNACHGKLFKNSIIKIYGLLFDEYCSYGEDLLFNYNFFYHINSFYCVSDTLYYYRINFGGLSTAFRPEQFDQDYGQWQIIKRFYKDKGLWDCAMENNLFKRLWGIVYDGIFLYPKLEQTQRNYLRKILSIPEIDALKEKQDIFNCSRWIKWCVVHRLSGIFHCYFKITT